MLDLPENNIQVKQTSILCFIIGVGEKSFTTQTPVVNVIKLFCHWRHGKVQLCVYPWQDFSALSNICEKDRRLLLQWVSTNLAFP
jgi:hypothetical protein